MGIFTVKITGSEEKVVKYNAFYSLENTERNRRNPDGEAYALFTQEERRGQRLTKDARILNRSCMQTKPFRAAGSVEIFVPIIAWAIFQCATLIISYVKMMDTLS